MSNVAFEEHLSVESDTVTPSNSAAPFGEPVANAMREVEADRQLRKEFRKLGIYSPTMLDELLENQTSQPYLVDGLLPARSINLLVGDSGLGKTPLAIQIGACVAAGIPVLGREVHQQGRVLYCDAESDLHSFLDTLGTISRFLGLRERPEEFHAWSPNWDEGSPLGPEWAQSWGDKLLERVEKAKPVLVIVDPLRMFWPDAVTKGADTAARITSLRKVSKLTDCSWLISHHRRKVNQEAAVVHLEDDSNAWFQEASGALALVNHVDARFGVEPRAGRGDLILGGFVRGLGSIAPLSLGRVADDHGNPIGYRPLTGPEHLRPEDRLVFDGLPLRFRFKDLEVAMGGTSSSNSMRLLKKCVSLGIVRKNGIHYEKVVPTVERVEQVELP